MHGAHPDLRFTIDDLIAEDDRVTIRWTLHGTNTGPMLGRPPTGQPVELAAIVIFRIADGKIAERWAGWKPGQAPFRTYAGSVSHFRTLPSLMTSPPSQHHCTRPPSNCSL